jgi:2,5-diketo-D-gluconate reductase A
MADGWVRAIGTSNFKPSHIERLVEETGVAPDVNQIQLNPLLTRRDSRHCHARNGIRTQSWSPLALGVQRERASEGARTRAAGNLLQDAVVTDIARKVRKTPAQVILRWHIELGVTPIPKSSNPVRLAENVEVFDFSLDPSDIDAITALDRGDVSAVDSDDEGH